MVNIVYGNVNYRNNALLFSPLFSVVASVVAVKIFPQI